MNEKFIFTALAQFHLLLLEYSTLLHKDAAIRCEID